MSNPPASHGTPINGVENDRQTAQSFGARLLTLLGLRGTETSFRESLEELIEEHDEASAPLDDDERIMFRNLLDFAGLEVADVMVPRADIVAVPVGTSLSDLIAVMRKAGHSRLPVHRDTLDDVVGMIHVRDLLEFWGNDKEFSLAAVARTLLFVPPSMAVPELLLEMRATKIHMAMVIDEYGGTDGLVTIEDLVEEIVGEIEDEHDRTVEPKLVEPDNGVIEADARVPIEDLEAMLGLDLRPDDRDADIDTLGGLVFDLAGRVPVRGELVAHPAGITFEVVDAEPRRVRRLRVHHAGDRERAAPPAAG
ncbi:MAG: hemolysin family protein [Alphaproteobacteria bacterium]|jgi:CBS domain containing-hemolysin-like protein|nr:hemolysin family protein [Alphaproteobacteria bacterium]MDP6516441.1 hemolysin family protein [Alphaproteobacteria bacterium]